MLLEFPTIPDTGSPVSENFPSRLLVPQAPDSLTPEERHQIYKMLRVQVSVGPNETVEVTGAFTADSTVCNSVSARTRGTGTPCSVVLGR